MTHQERVAQLEAAKVAVLSSIHKAQPPAIRGHVEALVALELYEVFLLAMATARSLWKV